jgi:uncharacterized membrane protein YgdD (TMEM256/DUF423 family)
VSRDRLILAAGLSGAIAVAAGAFAAHGAGADAAALLRTGALYQLVHAGLAATLRQRRAAAVMLAGSGLFAATLYAMAFGGPRWLGAVTPLGGAAMIAGWLMLALDGWRR